MKKKSRERGSAIILAILLLSFFMALSLNMFFIAQKKSERAGVKAKGVKVLSTIDGGAAIAYYELKKASDYVTNGIELNPTTTRSFILGGVTTINAIEGVVMENYNQFFAEHIAGTATQPALYQEGSNPRNWVVKTEMKRLWETLPSAENRVMSIGGYEIALNGTNRILQLNGAQTNLIAPKVNNATVEVTYEKYLKISGGENIGDLTYKITCKEKYRTDASGDVKSDDIEDMTIEGK